MSDENDARADRIFTAAYSRSQRDSASADRALSSVRDIALFIEVNERLVSWNAIVASERRFRFLCPVVPTVVRFESRALPKFSARPFSVVEVDNTFQIATARTKRLLGFAQIT